MEASGIVHLAIVAALAMPAAACPAGSYTGFTTASRTLEIAAADTAVIDKIHVAPGDHVEPGQLVAELDKTVLLAEREIHAARAEADGERAAARARLGLAEDRLARLADLLRRGAARPDEVAEARAARDVAAAQFDAATDEQRIAVLRLGAIDAQLARREIRSPIAGVVVEVHRDLAELVSAAEPRIATVQTLAPLHVEVYVPSTCRAQLRAVAHVPLTLVTTGDALSGTVERFAAEIDEASDLILMTLELPNPDARVLGGERVEVHIAEPD